MKLTLRRIVRDTLAATGMALVAAMPAAAQQRAPVTVSVRADRPGARIDRHIFGQFAEHLGTGIYGGVWVGRDSAILNVRGIRSDVVAALRALKVPDVRWPGGCFAEEYHWRDGIGPQDRRRVNVNANWGGSVEPDSFGTDEFMDFVDQIGSEAYVSVNVGSGTVGEAAAWMQYMTGAANSTAGRERAANGHAAPYKVAFLGLGNESWGCGGAMRPDHYVDEMKAFARFVRNYNPAQAGDGGMVRVAVGPDAAKTAYTEAVMQAWKEHDWSWNIEGLSLHSYSTGGWPPHLPSTGFGQADYAVLLKEALGMESLIATHGTIMDRYDPGRKVALVVDEWGAWLAPNPGTDKGFLQQQNSMRDAILAALTLDIFARHADRVRMANIAQMANVLQAMVLTDGPRMVLTPTYHVFRMYVPFQDATLVPVGLDAGTVEVAGTTLPRVDAIAARGKDGRLWVALTNIDPDRPATIELDVAGARARSAAGSVLTAPRIDSVDTFAAPDTVTPRPIAATAHGGRLSVTLPARSVTVLELRP